MITGDALTGVFLVDKPIGPTSFACVHRFRRILGIKKIGHAGTLDPFASGLLLLCVGRPATKQIQHLMAGRKTYKALLQLGVETTTQDPEGQVTVRRPVPALTEQELVQTLQGFVGPQMQAPPPYSAAKHQGKPLYLYARQGQQIIKAAKPIEIHSLCLDHYDPQSQQLAFTVQCSPGTYIRVLGEDLGRSLGCGAHLIALRRTASGPFSVDQAVDGHILFTPSLPPQEALVPAMLSVEQALGRVEEDKNNLLASCEEDLPPPAYSSARESKGKAVSRLRQG